MGYGRGLVAGLILSSSFSVSSSELIEFKRTTLCGKFSYIVEMMRHPDTLEVPFWIGTDQDKSTHYVLFKNQRSGAFTLVHANKEVGCVLGIGYESLILEEKK